MDLYTPVRAVDFTDTGLWRLIIYISSRGMLALLRHTEDPSQPLVCLFDSKWDNSDSGLLSKIEACVYDHPRVLEDYATDIIVETPRQTWVPDELLDTEDAETRIFCALYPSQSEEVMIESVGGMTSIFSLVRGLQAFASRTLPGARIRSHIGIIADNFIKRTSPQPRIYADIRQSVTDFVVIDNHRILLTASHACATHEEIAYRVMQIIKALDLDPSVVELSLSGNRDMASALTESLTEFLATVSVTDVPECAGDQIPLAAAFLAGC